MPITLNNRIEPHSCTAVAATVYGVIRLHIICMQTIAQAQAIEAQTNIIYGDGDSLYS